MTVTPVGTSAAHNDGSSIAIPAPAVIVTGNLLVAVVQCSNFAAQTFGLPSGWTQAGASSPGSNAGSLLVAYKYATGSEPSSYTFTISSGTPGLAGVISEYAFVAASSPIDDIAFTPTSFGSTFTAPSVTASATTDMLCCGFGSVDGVAVGSTPGGMTDRVQSITGGDVGVNLTDQTLSASGATGTRAQTFSSGDTGTAVSFLILAGASGGLPAGPAASPIHANRTQAVMRASVI